MALIPSKTDRITDPKFLHELVWYARLIAQVYNWIYSSDISPTLLVQYADGTTREVERLDTPETYGGAHILTYIGQPERFRGYWRQLADLVEKPAVITEELDGEVYGPDETTTVLIDDLIDVPGFQQRQRKIQYTVEGAMDPELRIEEYPNPEQEEPAWSGAWPSGYYATTIPQIIDALGNLGIGRPSETVSVSPFPYVGTSIHEELHSVDLDPGVRYDFVWAANELVLTAYVRNHSDEDVHVPYSVIVTPASPYNSYITATLEGGISPYFTETEENISGTLWVPPRNIAKVQIGGFGGVIKDEIILIDPENPPPLDPNRFIEDIPTVQIDLRVGDYGLTRTFPSLFAEEG